MVNDQSCILTLRMSFNFVKLSYIPPAKMSQVPLLAMYSSSYTQPLKFLSSYKPFALELTALATFKCYSCNNIPGYEKSSPCNGEDAESVTCDSVLYDRCMTLTGTITAPGHVSLDIKIKNCTSSFVCNPGSIFNSK